MPYFLNLFFSQQTNIFLNDDKSKCIIFFYLDIMNIIYIY